MAIFFILIYSILGVSLYDGSLNYRCRTTPAPVNGSWPIVDGDVQLCDPTNQARICPVGYCGSLYNYYLACLFRGDDCSYINRT